MILFLIAIQLVGVVLLALLQRQKERILGHFPFSCHNIKGYFKNSKEMFSLRNVTNEIHTVGHKNLSMKLHYFLNVKRYNENLGSTRTI